MTIKLNSFFIACLAAFILFISACKVRIDGDTPSPAVKHSASYKVGGTDVAVTAPYDGVFIDNGIVNNSVSLNGKDGSEITFSFTGATPASYQLNGYPDAVYKSPAGVQYNVVSGILTITSYKVSGATNTFSGAFSFVARAITNDQSTITIANGIITNCSNEFNQ